MRLTSAYLPVVSAMFLRSKQSLHWSQLLKHSRQVLAKGNGMQSTIIVVEKCNPLSYNIMRGEV